MANLPELPSNLTHTITRYATADTLADRVGNPTPAHVLSTPTLIAWFESAVSQAMLPYLDPSYLILGAHIEINHRRPTPPGHGVQVTATLVSQEGNKTQWHLEARDEVEVVADGLVVSALVDATAFEHRLSSKRKPLASPPLEGGTR